MSKRPRVEHHIYDSDFPEGAPHKVRTQKEVDDYVSDTFISDSPVHIETFHNGVSQGVKTRDPRIESAVRESKFAFRKH